MACAYIYIVFKTILSLHKCKLNQYLYYGCAINIWHINNITIATDVTMIIHPTKNLRCNDFNVQNLFPKSLLSSVNAVWICSSEWHPDSEEMLDINFTIGIGNLSAKNFNCEVKFRFITVTKCMFKDASGSETAENHHDGI